MEAIYNDKTDLRDVKKKNSIFSKIIAISQKDSSSILFYLDYHSVVQG